jgi:hypothetical protein
MYFYPLTEKVFRQVVVDVAARRVERVQAGGDPANT